MQSFLQTGKKLENTCPTKGPEKEMKNQVDWAMPNLKEKCGKNAEQLKGRRKSAVWV